MVPVAGTASDSDSNERREWTTRRQRLTERYRRFGRAAVLLLVLCAAGAVAAALPGASRAAAAFVGTTTQLTNRFGVQADPSISGDIVVFTDNSGGLGDDVRYIDLTNPGVDVAVASAAGDQRLHDVSGNTIVYTDQSASPERIFKYDVPSATATLLSAGNDRNPRLDGQIVAFERGFLGATDIIAIDLANPGV